MAEYGIGLDFGTLSARAVLIGEENGSPLAQAEYKYPHGVLSALPEGEKLPERSALAHPADYIEGLQTLLTDVIQKSGVDPADIKSIGVDATSSSVVPLGKNGLPLCMQPEFADRAHAYIKLWKHQTAVTQTERLQRVAEDLGERFLTDCGNKISVESFFSKVLETFEEDREVYDAAFAFCEVGEWITLLLTGKLITSESTAAFKRFYHPFRGYPAPSYFDTVARGFGSVVRDKIHGDVLPVGESVGTLHPKMAKLLGLGEDVTVSVPLIDAHSAVAACGGNVGDLILIMGTSGVELLVSHNDTGMNGVFSSAAHTFLPDVYGHEAGQSSVGDTLSWFAQNYMPPEYHDSAIEKQMSPHEYLTSLAEKLPAGGSGLLALDWNAGVRTPLMDFTLSGALIGLTNGTRPEEIYRALLEAVAFGVRRNKECFETHGHTVSRVLCCGGIPKKNRLFCRILSNVLGREIEVLSVTNACAVGSAIQGVIARGKQPARTVLSARCITETEAFSPDFEEQAVYDRLYKEYLRLSDRLSDYEGIMQTLFDIKRSVG